LGTLTQALLIDLSIVYTKYNFNGRGRMKMMKTAEQLIQNVKSRIQEVSVNELFEAMQNHQPIAQPFLCQQHVHSIKQNN